MQWPFTSGDRNEDCRRSRVGQGRVGGWGGGGVEDSWFGALQFQIPEVK